MLQPEIPSEGGVSCKIHLWESKRLRCLSWTAKRLETQWLWMFFINPAQEPPNTLVCFAMISSYFYRLLFFCLNCLARKISLPSFSSGLSVSTSCLSQNTTFQGSPCTPSLVTVAACRAIYSQGQSRPTLSWPCVAIPAFCWKMTRAALAPSCRERQDTRETGQQPKPTLGLCTNRSGNEPGLPGAPKEKYHDEQM